MRRGQLPSNDGQDLHFEEAARDSARRFSRFEQDLVALRLGHLYCQSAQCPRLLIDVLNGPCNVECFTLHRNAMGTGQQPRGEHQRPRAIVSVAVLA
ncbi:hypothetical protein [Lentzea californiensis]|uniref:hypothetical protein n=1 Tax=Lentzea californiensis TaxID=438851 RepID=UPI00216620FC|nr:hypothetical protein [Lentzea californiensis]